MKNKFDVLTTVKMLHNDGVRRGDTVASVMVLVCSLDTKKIKVFIIDCRNLTSHGIGGYWASSSVLAVFDSRCDGAIILSPLRWYLSQLKWSSLTSYGSDGIESLVQYKMGAIQVAYNSLMTRCLSVFVAQKIAKLEKFGSYVFGGGI